MLGQAPVRHLDLHLTVRRLQEDVLGLSSTRQDMGSEPELVAGLHPGLEVEAGSHGVSRLQGLPMSWSSENN